MCGKINNFHKQTKNSFCVMAFPEKRCENQQGLMHSWVVTESRYKFGDVK